MSFTASVRPMATGLSGDVLMEHLIVAGSDVTLSSSLVQFPTGTNNKKCLVLLVPVGASIISGSIIVLSAKIAVSAAPTTEINLFTDGAQATTHSLLRVGTDGKLKVYSDSGILIASSTSTVSTNSVSPTEFIATFDGVTLPQMWVSLVVNGTEEAAMNAMMAPSAFLGSADYRYFGDYTPAGSNRGATMTGSMIVCRSSTTAGDAPHLTPYPRLLGGAPNPPTSDGDSHAWPNGTDTGGDGVTVNTYKEVDESPNDGATTRIADIQSGDTPPKVSHDNLFHYSAANPYDNTMTIDYVQTKHVGALQGASKNYCSSLLKLAGSTAAVTLAVLPTTTTYVGAWTVHNTTPAGGSWAYTDFNLTGGVSDLQWGLRSIVASGIDTGADVSMCWSPVAIYHTATVTTSTPYAVLPPPMMPPPTLYKPRPPQPSASPAALSLLTATTPVVTAHPRTQVIIF